MIRLLPAGALAALLAGAARIAAGVWPLESGTMLAEAVYGAIDFGFLFALATLFLATYDRLGWRGWPSFLLATLGAAILVGPNGTAGGVSGFVLGAGALLVGLSSLGILLLWRDRRFAVPGAAWVCALVLALTGQPDIAGIVLAAGFVAAGVILLRREQAAGEAAIV
ncbi:MAG: hypothetical protein ACK4MQ_01815 [Hyphomonas sp.]